MTRHDLESAPSLVNKLTSAYSGLTLPPFVDSSRLEPSRFCALPDVQRQAEIDRVKTESGVTLVCPHP